MKLLYAIASAFFTMVVAMITAGVTMDPYWAIMASVATTGGFICYAIVDTKDKN